MCLTSEMFATFLNILSPQLITNEPGKITVHADVGDKIWVAVDDFWCTDEPTLMAAAE